MDDKEKRKVGDALFEKYAAKGQSVVDKAGAPLRSVHKESGEWAKTAKKAITTAFKDDYATFDESVSKGSPNVDPKTYINAKDGKQGPLVNDVTAKIKSTKERLEKEYLEGTNDPEYRKAKIAEIDQKIRNELDKRGSDTLVMRTTVQSGSYDVGLVRMGEKGEFSIGKNGQPMFMAYKDEPETVMEEEAAEKPAGLPMKNGETPSSAETVNKEESGKQEATKTVTEEETAPGSTESAIEEAIEEEEAPISAGPVDMEKAEHDELAEANTEKPEEPESGVGKEISPETDIEKEAEVTGPAMKKEAKAEPVEITVNGKPIVVKPSLTGDAVSFEGRYPELSQDLARESVAKMAECGTTKWAKEVGEGEDKHLVEVAMKGFAGRTQVMVDENLKGDEMAARAGGPRVSEGFWDMAKGNMSVNGTYNYATTMPDGKTVTCGIHVKVNGKPAMIDGWGGKDAAGEESISSDKFQHALNQMKELGTQHWAETLQDGTIIQVGISTQIDGDKRTMLDWGNGKIEATIEPEKILVSKDTWMEAAENMLAGEGGKRSFEKTLADGTTVEFRMGARIDGRGAVIEENFGGREVREERDRVLVGKDIFKDATQEMSDKRSVTAKAVDRNGNEVEFKRHGKIQMFVNGIEINDADYEEALAEVAGMNNGKDFAKIAEAAKNAKEQVGIQGIRTGTRAAISAPINIAREGGRKNAGLLAQLLSAVISTFSRAASRGISL